MGWSIVLSWDSRSAARCFVAVASLCILLPETVQAGAWLRDEGRTEIIFSGQFTGADQRFDRSGNSLRTGHFTKKTFQTVADYGLTQEITLIAGFLGQYQSIPSLIGRRASAEGGIVAGARAKLWTSGATILSTQFTAEASGIRNFGLVSRRFSPPVSADARLLLGHAFEIAGVKGFIEAQTAYRWRSGAHPDELHLDLTLGLRPFSRTLLLLQSFNNLTSHRDRRFGLAQARQHKLQASAVYDITDQLALQIGGFATIAGKERLKERGIVSAIWWKL